MTANATPPRGEDATSQKRSSSFPAVSPDEPTPLRRTLVVTVLGAAALLTALIALLWRPLWGTTPQSSTPTVGRSSSDATCCSAIPDRTALGP